MINIFFVNIILILECKYINKVGFVNYYLFVNEFFGIGMYNF